MTKELDKIDEQDFHDAWIGNPLTMKKRAELERRRLGALSSVISTASSSSDPHVRAAHAKYRELDVLVVEMGGSRFTDGVK